MSTQAVSDPNGNQAIPDPQRLLLDVAIQLQQGEIGIQAAFASLLGLQSAAATLSLDQAQAIASGYATNVMEKETTSSGMQEANTIYNTMMTQISDITNKYQNIESGTATTVSNLTQTQAQSLQLCQVVVDFLNSMGQLITMLAG